MNADRIPLFENKLPPNKVMYLTKDLLLETNKASIREKRNRKFSEEFLKSLKDDIPYVVVDSHFHKSNEMRLEIAFNRYEFGFLDISVRRYKTLPIGTIAEDKSIIPEDPAITLAKRPYGDGREWQESTYIKPVREQSRFRKEVLKAYSNQCAVCSINNPKMLMASHIIPVTDSANDTVTNGLCLCFNHSKAFDDNLLIIKPDGEIIINDNSDMKVELKKIRFPKNKKDYPSKENLMIRYRNIYPL